MTIYVVLMFVLNKTLVAAFSTKELAEKYSKTLGKVKYEIREIIVDNILKDMAL